MQRCSRRQSCISGTLTTCRCGRRNGIDAVSWPTFLNPTATSKADQRNAGVMSHVQARADIGSGVHKPAGAAPQSERLCFAFGKQEVCPKMLARCLVLDKAQIELI